MSAIGLQLYTLRQAMAEDFRGTLTRVRELGYTEVEFAGYFKQTPAAVAALLKQLGLRAPSAHIPIDLVRTRLEQLIADAQVMGHHNLVVPWLAPEQRQSLDQYRQLAETLNSAGEKCRAAGIHLGYHNHDFEFQAIDTVRPYDLLLENTVAELVTMELDLYWAIRAGQDPLQYFARHPGRFSQCHVKDMAADGSMADVGSGVIDYAALLPAARAAGVRHFYVEHDQPDDAMKSVSNSIHFLQKLEF